MTDNQYQAPDAPLATQQRLASAQRQRLADGAAIAMSAVWFVALTASAFSTHLTLGWTVIVLAYVFSCAGLILHHRRALRFGLLPRGVSMGALFLFAYSVYVLALGLLPIIAWPEGTGTWLRFSSFLLPGIGATLIMLLAVLIPGALLFKKWTWLIPLFVLFANAGAAGLSADMLNGTSLSQKVILFEMATLLLVGGPLLAWMAPHVRRWCGPS